MVLQEACQSTDRCFKFTDLVVRHVLGLDPSSLKENQNGKCKRMVFFHY